MAPPVALYSSSTSQPASQHASLRMTSKLHNNQVSSNVMLGTNAGAGPSKGGGREERVGVQAIPDECVHSKDGTCTLHGPGAVCIYYYTNLYFSTLTIFNNEWSK